MSDTDLSDRLGALGGSRSPRALAICKPRRSSRGFFAAWRKTSGDMLTAPAIRA
jgi:hypothetical protein